MTLSFRAPSDQLTNQTETQLSLSTCEVCCVVNKMARKGRTWRMISLVDWCHVSTNG